MGNNIAAKDNANVENKEKNNNEINYTEIVYGLQTDISDITPIKIINDQLTSSAVDSIRESQLAANQLAKSLLIELLHDEHSPKKFGELLKYTFAYESVLKPTRDLIHWSLRTDSTMTSVEQQARTGLYSYMSRTGSAKSQLVGLSTHWLGQRDTRLFTLNPLLTWTMKQPELAVDPLAEVVKVALPHTRSSVVESMQYYALEALKSEDVK